jgi:hypothetical protein
MEASVMTAEAATSPPSGARMLGFNLLLAVVSIAVTLYLVEAVLALLGRNSAVGECPRLQIETDKCEAARAAGLPFDSRSRVELMRDLEAQRDSVWPNFNSWELNIRGDTIMLGGRPIQPLGGISLVRTLYCNERGRYELFASDEFGFRNPAGLQVAPIDLALIGDSFVQGYCVPSDSTAVAFLRARFPRTVNLGRDNHGPLSQLAVFREYAARLQPRVVLWFFFEGNDLEDLEIEKQREPLVRYLDSGYSARLADYPDSLDRQLREVVRIKRNLAEERQARRRNQPSDQPSGFRAFATLSRIRQMVAGVRQPQPVFPFDQSLYRRILQQAHRESAAWGGRLTLVYLPAWPRFGEPSLVNPHRDSVLRIASDLGIPVVDLVPAFQQSGDPVGLFPFRLPGPYEPEGQRLIAAEILRALPPDVGP